MSNLIKASAIRYTEDSKKIDTNDRADAYQQEYMDKYIANNIALKQISFDEVSRSMADGDGGFVPGLFGERVTVGEDEEQGFLADASENEAYGTPYDDAVSSKQQELQELEEQIEQLKSQRDQMIEEANLEAERLVRDAEDEAEARKEEIYSNASEQGYQAGMSRADSEINAARQQLEHQMAENDSAYRQKVQELEPAFVNLVMKYVQKLTGIYEEDKREIIFHLIGAAMEGRKLSGEFLIRVSAEDYQLVSAQRSKVEEILGDKCSFEIIEDKLLCQNKCMIETESRIFDCSLGVQLEGLFADLRLLAEI